MTHSGCSGYGLSVDYDKVLIPLLLDDPLWAVSIRKNKTWAYSVLIPLLLDDPLWDE